MQHGHDVVEWEPIAHYVCHQIAAVSNRVADVGDDGAVALGDAL